MRFVTVGSARIACCPERATSIAALNTLELPARAVTDGTEPIIAMLTRLAVDLRPASAFAAFASVLAVTAGLAFTLLFHSPACHGSLTNAFGFLAHRL